MYSKTVLLSVLAALAEARYVYLEAWREIY